MTDIVGRLVALANSLGGTEEDDIMAGVAEIERLRAASADLATENERLRAALDRAADALEFYDNKAEAQKARRALEPPTR